MYGKGKVLTCAVCGLPLSPEEARKCSVCGRYVCRDHIRYHPIHGWVCTSCLKKLEGNKRTERELVVGVAYVDL